MVASIAEQMGMRYTYFAPGISSFKGYPIGFPGAIITRYEIVEAENCPLIQGSRPDDLFTRHWGRAVLRTDTEQLAFFSGHLHPSSADIRAREITEMRISTATLSTCHTTWQSETEGHDRILPGCDHDPSMRDRYPSQLLSGL